MNPRNAELSLVILAVIIAVGTITLVDIATSRIVGAELYGFTALFGGVAIVGHLAIRRFAPGSDPLLYGVTVLLTGFGYGVIRRLDPDLAAAQLGWFAIAMVAFVATLWILHDHRVLEQFRYSLMVFGVLLLLLPLTPIGLLRNGARLWIQVGPMNFQPAELAKIVLAAFLAGYLSQKREVMNIAVARIGPMGIPAPRHFGPLILAWLVSLAVMFYERDLGSSLLFFTLFVVTMYIATSRAVYAVVGFGMFAAGTWFAYTQFAHVQTRICAWLNPWGTDFNDPCGLFRSGRQIAQSYLALGSGGFTGAGLGQGYPEEIDPNLASGTLPTDFIFSAIGEELGLLGTAAILLLFGLIVARGLHIALRSRDTFGTLLAASLTIIIGVQALLIMGGVSRLLPLTGITLPFVSYGGSSLFANFILVALLMRISDGEAA